MKNERLTQTIDGGAPLSRASASDSAPRQGVGIRSESEKGFSRETEELLRKRLLIVTLLIIILAFVAFIQNLFQLGVNLPLLRVVVGFLCGACLAILWKVSNLRMRHLRSIEFCVFGLVILQVALLTANRLNYFADLGDSTSVGVVVGASHAAFTLLICLYGMFIPNRWQCTLIITLSIALVPLMVFWFTGLSNEALLAMTESIHWGLSASMPFYGVLAAVFSTYSIHQIRRQSFDAKQLNQYRLGERLGKGGMGEVYIAEHQLLQRPCAIKLIHPEKQVDELALKRFAKEVKATAKLTHFNTIEVFDYGFTPEGIFYYVMELLPGMDLGKLIQNYDPLPPKRAVHILVQCCDALIEAHEKGLIHRDLKPGNIVITERGGVFDIAKLIDYGLVRDKTTESEGGSAAGSPLYMSPEQVDSFDSVDGRSDIYALGCIAYFMLSGFPPFSGRSIFEVIDAHHKKLPDSISATNSEIPKALDDIILQCLAKKPDDRFQAMREFKTALKDCSVGGRWTANDAEKWWKKNYDKR